MFCNMEHSLKEKNEMQKQYEQVMKQADELEVIR
jgi:hypothetical protein